MLKLNVVIVAAGCALAACQGPKPTPAATSAAPPVASTPPAPAPATAALTTPFEGEIVVNVKREAEAKVPTSVTFDVKGDKIRYAPAGASVREVADVAAQHAFAISDAKKEFTAIDTKPPSPAASATDAKVTKSNFTQKFAGVACDDWTIDDPSGTVDVCVAKGVPFFDPASDARKGKAEPAWAAALTREKAFPLRVIAYDAKGKEEYRAEATKVDAKKLDDALFQVPAGFKQADLSADLRTAGLP